MQHGGSTTASPTRYTGADRRQRRPAARQSVSVRELTLFIAALAVVGLAVPTALDRVPSLSTAVHAQSALRTTWSVLFVCAGILRMVRWRLTGEARAALLGTGMFCFGLISAPTAALAPLIEHDSMSIWLSPVTRFVAVAAFQATLIRVFLSPAVRTAVRPLRTTTRLLLTSASVLALIIAAQHLVAPIDAPPRFWFLLGASQAGAWFVFSAAALFTGYDRADASMFWIGLGLLLLGTAELLHAIAFVQPHASAFYATCLQIVAAGIAITNSAMDLSLVFSADSNHMLLLSGQLQDAELMLTEEERLQAERLHDARSVIAALKAASFTLDRYDERLDTEVKHRLRSSLVSELARLEQVIDGRRQEPLSAFRLSAALEPLLVAERENDLDIKVDLKDIAVVGRPLELATVVQNLLVNARRYAAGSVVRITAVRMRQHVQITVEDKGPGIDPTQHELVFERGHRCSPAGDGSGLGLYLARRLMREQGGEIVVRNRTGGGTSMVLTLRAPAWNQKIEDSIEVSHSANRQLGVGASESDAAAVAEVPRQRDNNASGERRRGRVGHDEVDQKSLVRRADVQAT